MRAYIAGPVTDEVNYHFRFQQAEDILRECGYDVVNPTKLKPHPSASNTEPASWGDWMRVCIPAMMACDCVVVLRGWQDSKGAAFEVYSANLVGIPVHDLKEIYPNAKP